MAKDIIYRLEFEGAESELNKLVEIRKELDKIAIEKLKLDKNDTEAYERNKLQAQELQKQYRAEQQAIKDKQKEQKAVAGSLEQLRLEAKRLGKELEKTWAVGTPEFKKAASALEEVNRKIRNADKSAGNFKSNIGNYAGSIGDAFQGIGVNVGSLTSSLGAATMATGPLGVGFAALVGGAQLFGKALQATDTISDKFAITMEKAKAATQVFFKALAEGDFSNFLTNIRAAIAEGERYAKTIDYLEDAQRGASVTEAAYRLQIAELKIVMRDRSKSDEERIAAINKIVEIEKEIGRERVRLSKIEVENELQNKAVINQINKDKLRDFIQNYKNYEKQIEFVEKLQDAERRLREEKAKSGGGASGFEVADQKEVRRLTDLVNKLQKATAGYSDTVIAFGRVAAPEREKIAQSLIKLYGAEAYATEETTRAQVMLGSLMAEAFGEKNKNVDGLKAINQELKIMQRTLSDMDKGLDIIRFFARQKGVATESLSLQGGLRSGAGTANLPTEPTEDEQSEVNRVSVDLAATSQAAGEFVSIWSDAYQKREEELKLSLQNGLISEQKYQKESEKLQKKQANLQRIIAISQLTADLARTLSALGVGAANTAKVGFPMNIPLLIAFAAQAAGIITNLKSIKLAEGGLIVGGKSHAAGGTKFIGSDGSHFEAERGELLAVVNKHDTARIGALSALNSVHGKPFYKQPSMSYFAQGGIYTPNQSASTMSSDMIRQIVSQIGTIPVVLSTNKIEKANKEQRKVEVIGSL